MGKCPNCGHKALSITTMKCKLCGKEVCEKCGIYLFKLWSSERIILDRWYACSQQCLQDFAGQVEKQITLKDLGTLNDLSYAIPILVKETLFRPENYRRLSNEVTSRRRDFVVNFAPLEELDYEPRGNQLWRRLLRLREYYESVEVSNWIKAGRFEEAAKFYEKRGMYKEAGMLRAKDREIRIRKTEVIVDLNSLLKQIADGGIVVVYRCPYCGGKLKIGKDNATETALRVCEHCCSEIQALDLAEFLKTALS